MATRNSKRTLIFAQLYGDLMLLEPMFKSMPPVGMSNSNDIFHHVLIFCSANPVSWQCQFLTQGSKLDLETSVQFSVEPPNDFIDENAIDDEGI